MLDRTSHEIVDTEESHAKRLELLVAKKIARSAKIENEEFLDFEQSVEELEMIVQRLEHGGGALEEALEDYSKAVRLIKSCHMRLAQAERKVEILSGVDAQGNPVSQPVTETENSSLEAKHGARGERRSATAVNPTKASAEPQDDLGGLF